MKLKFESFILVGHHGSPRYSWWNYDYDGITIRIIVDDGWLSTGWQRNGEADWKWISNHVLKQARIPESDWGDWRSATEDRRKMLDSHHRWIQLLQKIDDLNVLLQTST
jgi:hypothetical protein